MGNKVGIITIYDEDNYGNRLQNYAVQIILEKLGFQVETIRNINVIDGIDYLEEAKKVLPDRRKRFLEFNENYINVSEEIIYHDNVPDNFHENYDYFVIGSDQIWNHNFPDRFSNFAFAEFAPNEKKIALSASFGVNEIDVDKIELYEKIHDIKKISVRENAGKDILEKQFKRDDIVVLIDPTMALDQKDWEKVINKPKNMINKKYIMKYFLGPVSEERNKEILRFAKENDYEIIDLLDKKEKFYETGPSEFLYLIKNSEIVLTDSFHSCVFSILFNKPFLYFYREGNLKNINSRLETLFDKFDIRDRIYDGKINNNTLNYEYKDIDKKINLEKEKLNNFLKNALNL